MEPNVRRRSWLEGISRHKKIITGSAIVTSVLLVFVVAFWLPLPWRLAHKASVPVVPVKLAIKDHEDLWHAEYEGGVDGSGAHWLGYKGINAPAGRDGGLWYDGAFIAKETKNSFFKDYQLSSNGEHYAYNQDVQRTDVDATTISKLVVDGKEVARGKGLLLYEITDSGDVYYTCRECGKNSNGFFRNNQKLIDQHDDAYWGGPDNIQQIQCLFRRDADVKWLTRKLTHTTDMEITACSPNGKYFVTDKPESVWPEGSKDVLFVDGSKVDEGGIENFVINDRGELTYLKRRIPLLTIDTLTINGRPNYIISEPGYPPETLYSPSLKNIALVQNGEWWVNGRPTGVGRNESVSLSDTAFYVYRF